MIIIGTKNEIERLIKEECPYLGGRTAICNQDSDCRTCWNKAASLVVIRPEMIGRVGKYIDGVSFLERLKGSEEK